jgi:predicted ATPase with chaperone activity
VFLYNSNSQAVELVKAGKRIAEKCGIAFHGLTYPACACGHFASSTCECRCRPATMKRHLGKLGQRKAEFDLWMDACLVKPAGIKNAICETEDVVAERVLAARRVSEVCLQPDKEASELLNAWQRHVGTACNTDSILRVAQTIGRMEGSSKTLRTHHVAEAIQYQAASLSWLWVSVEPGRFEVTINQKEQRKEVK